MTHTSSLDTSKSIMSETFSKSDTVSNNMNVLANRYDTSMHSCLSRLQSYSTSSSELEQTSRLSSLSPATDNLQSPNQRLHSRDTFSSEYIGLKRPLTRGRRAVGSARHPCHICGRYYSRKDNLRVHQRIHSGEMPYRCNDCGKRFRWQSTWQAHRDAPRCRAENIEYRKSSDGTLATSKDRSVYIQRTPPCSSGDKDYAWTGSLQSASNMSSESEKESAFLVNQGTSPLYDRVQRKVTKRLPSAESKLSVVSTAEIHSVPDGSELNEITKDGAIDGLYVMPGSPYESENMSMDNAPLSKKVFETLSRFEVSLAALTNLISISAQL